jgi:hypothetical protein
MVAHADFPSAYEPADRTGAVVPRAPRPQDIAAAIPKLR